MKKKYLICEVANSHNGNKNNLLNLIKSLSKVKYNNLGVKLQIISDSFLSVKGYKWHETYKKLYLNEKTWKKIINFSSQELDVWLDIFDVYGAKILKENLKKVHGIKLQSSVLSNNELLEELKKIDLRRKKILINIAGHGIDEVKKIINNLNLIFKNKPIIQLGFQDYPTLEKDIHLNKIFKLKSFFKKFKIGFADHLSFNNKNFTILPSMGFYLGYDYMEKHICLNRSKSKYDFQSAAEIKEIKNIIKLIKKKNYFSKNFLKRFYRYDFNSFKEKEYLRKSILQPLVSKNMKRNSLISTDNLIYRRTHQEGLNLDEINEIVKKKYILSKNVRKFSTLKNSSFKKAKIGVVVACRMKSSRLKGKALRKIYKKISVQRCLDSCLNIKSAKTIILATSHLKSDDKIAKLKLNKKFKIFRGHPDDVIDRYIKAAKKHDIDTIIRVTADCPYVSYEIVDYLVQSHFNAGADFTFATKAAPGTTAEIYNLKTLQYIKTKTSNTNLSEYMTWYVMNNQKYFKINEVNLPSTLVRNYRLTLDYDEDLELFNVLYKKLHTKKMKTNLKNIFKIMDQNSNYEKINKNCKLIFKTDKKLINHLNANTRFA